MSQSRSTLGLLTVLLILSALSVGVWLRLRPPPEETEEVQEVSDEEREVVESVVQQFNTEIPTAVMGAVAIQDTLRIYKSATARAEAFREVKLSAQVSGIVQSVRVRENQSVRGGELLIRIDTTEYALALASSMASLERAQVDYEVKVLQDDVLEDPELRANRARLARVLSGLPQAQVEVRRAEINLQRTRVTTPFEGRIADLKVVVGQYVGSGEELLTVVDVDPIKVSVSALELDVADLEEGRGASLVFSALPDTTFQGTIETINPVVDLETTSTRVTVVLPNSDGRIRPGMSAQAYLEAQQVPDVVIVPRTAIRETPDRRSFLFVVKEGRSDWHYVSLGRMNDYLVEILPTSQDPVYAGEIVLIDGHQSIIHDAAIELVEDVAEAGGRPTR